jgi:diguanylate cyclase
MIRVLNCVTEQHDLRLVALAACICVLACTTTVHLLARTQSVPTGKAWMWLGTAAVLFGSGVWALHFVAMLAFIPAAGFSYRTAATVASALVAVAGTMLGFAVWRFASNPLVSRLGGGVLVGSAICGMHYIGVRAIKGPSDISFDRSLVVASVLVGVAFVTLAFARTGAMNLYRRRIEIAAWLAIGVCGVHFTAMSAMTLTAGPVGVDDAALLGTQSLGAVVGSVALAILVVGMVAALMEKRLSDRAALELAHMRALSDIAREALVVCRNGIILQANAACGRMFRVPADAMVGQRALGLFTEPFQAKVTDMMSTAPLGSAVQAVQARTADGSAIPVEVSLGEILYDEKAAIVMTMLDLSDRKRNEERIRHLALHDALTSLPNRTLLRERFEHSREIAARTGQLIALLYLDLDRFKPVNDALGHAAGDELLVQVAARLSASVRGMDTLSRIGGDEFVILASIEGAQEATVIASRIIEIMAAQFTILGTTVEIGTTVGIAVYPKDGIDQDMLMRAADTALYRAKQEKRGTYRVFEIGMDQQSRARRLMEQDLQRALEKGQMSVYYQPLINCSTGALTGFEALLRWQHPDRDFIPPSEFIPIAEESGLIVQFGKFVLESACHVAAGWLEPWRIAVNVSPVQLRNPGFLDEFLAVLGRTGLEPQRLEIEITEGVVMDGNAAMKQVLAALRALGVRLVLDDFGTGFSSLNYLHSFRFDKLKIDRSFIEHLEDREDSVTIVRTIIGLAHNLGIETVAEGVETLDEFAIVRDFMCDEVQGYLIGRPMPMDEPPELIAMRVKTVLAGLSRSDVASQRSGQVRSVTGIAS